MSHRIAKRHDRRILQAASYTQAVAVRMHSILDAAKEAVSFAQGKTRKSLDKNRMLVVAPGLTVRNRLCAGSVGRYGKYNKSCRYQ